MDGKFRNLTRSELRHVMEACSNLHLADPDKPFVSHCHSVLSQTFAHEHVSSESFEVAPFRPMDQVAPTIGLEWAPFAMEHIPEHPYFPRMSTKLLPDISTTEREPGYRLFTTTPLYNEFYAEIDGSSQMWIGLRDGNELLINMLYRKRAYTDAAVSMLEMVQPHLNAAWKSWKQNRAVIKQIQVLRKAACQSEEEEAEAALLRKQIDALPTRQRDVVELVAEGMDNQQVADELGISILTVKTHLQIIFKTLNVQHRTQLAAKWHNAFCVKLY